MSNYDSSTDNSQRNMNRDIRFINSQYDELFRIHDGGQIHVEKPEGGSYEIYQLKDIPENRDIHFERFSYLEKRGIAVSAKNYNAVYSGKLSAGETLDSIYERFNLHHPDDFRGHSLSVSDVVVIHKKDREIPYYVDAFGFRQVPEFFSENPLKTVEELLEDDYGMIDGILNNGDRRKDEEEKKPSVMEKIQEKKKEAAEAEASRPKPPRREKNADREMDLN